MAKMRRAVLAMFILLATCKREGCCQTNPGPGPAAPDGAPYSIVRVENRTKRAATVFASFGAGTVVTQADWAAFCAPLDADAGCSFPLAPEGKQDLPTGGKFLNATLSFGAYPACAVSLGEVDVSNPSWVQDTANISLVNGWNKDIAIEVTTPGDGGILLGPTRGPRDNGKVFGVYPSGCDICVARQNPPCGFSPCGSPDGSPSSCGCKGGTQYNPEVPCQASFDKGSTVTIVLVADVPAAM